jgi:dynein heavy chain
MQVRDQLLRVKFRLVQLLKGLTARIPRVIIASASAKAADLEKQLRAKANSIEEVDAQRK